MAPLVDVANILSDEMTNHRSIDVPDEVRSKNEAAIHGHENIETTPTARPGDLLAQQRNTRGDAPGGIPRTIARAHAIGPSAITVPRCVLSILMRAPMRRRPRGENLQRQKRERESAAQG